jgi:hypothetical protein
LTIVVYPVITKGLAPLVRAQTFICNQNRKGCSKKFGLPFFYFAVSQMVARLAQLCPESTRTSRCVVLATAQQ